MLDLVSLDIVHKDAESEKINAKAEKEGGTSRPEMDEEYENELIEKELPFYTTPLVKNGDNSGKPSGFIRYILGIEKADDPRCIEICNKFIANIDTMEKVIIMK